MKYGTTTAPDDPKRKMALALLREQANATGSDKAASRYGRLAEAYATAGSSTEPVGHWMQAVARGVQGAVGGMYDRMARDEDMAATQRAESAALAKEERDQQSAIELARQKALIEQSAPAYRAGLAKTEAEIADLTAKERYRKTLMGMLTGEDGEASAPSTVPPVPLAPPGGTDSLNVGGPPAVPPSPSNVPPPVSTPPPAQPGVQPQSFNGAAPMAQRLAQAYASPAGSPMPVQSPQPGMGMQPQSDPTTASRIAQAYTNAAPSPMPGVQTVADRPSPGAVPSSPGQPAPDMINTPFGPMTRERARRLGGAMMLDPQTATAGKAMFDQASAPMAPGLSQPTINAIQEKQLNTTEAYSRLRSIEQSFKPEYQEIESRVGFKWSELLDSFGATRKNLSPDQKAQLANFSAYRSDALNNLNQYIKEITGAAMTNAEAERIMKAMPNPGDSVFNGDSPTVFKAKLDAAIRSSKMALARYHYLSKNSFSGSVDDMAKQLPLERMGGVIQDRTNELLKDAMSQNPGLTPQDVAPLIRQRLRAEFGIDA